MYGIVLSALMSMLGFVVRSVIVKFVLFFGLFFVVSEFVPILATLFKFDTQKLDDLFNLLPNGIWYFLDAFSVGYGFGIILAAWVTRFIIRRIPVIG